MASLTDLGEEKILDKIFIDQVSFTQPTAYDAALFSVSPNEAGTGGTELTGDGYSRETLTANGTFFERTGSVITNANEILIGPATALWNAAVSMGLYIGSDLFLLQNLASPVAVANTNNFRLVTGAMEWTLGGSMTDWLRGELADWLFLGQSLTFPTQFELALTSTTPTASAAGTELTGSGYARQVVDNDENTWLRVNSSVTNVDDITWGEASANWLDVDGVDVYDPSGNRWFYIPGGPTVILQDNQFRIRSGNLQFVAA